MIIYRKINGIEFGVNPSKGSGLLCSSELAKTIDGDIYELVEYIYNQKNSYTPMVATWEITNGCNFHCPFCYINTTSKGELYIQSFSKMQKQIDDLVECGLLLVYLTGGEILTVPDFEKIYRYIKSKGVFVVLLTNLSLLAEKHISLLRELPPLRITASIYGLTNKQFSAATGADDTICQTVLDNIIKLNNMGIHITCQMPVNTYTISELLSIADWCYSNGIRFTFSNEMTDSYYHEDRSTVCIDDETFNQLKTQIRQIEAVESAKEIKIIREYGHKHHFDCKAGKHTFAISYNHCLRPCFNIWEPDCQVFNGSQSMKKAICEMTDYIQRLRQIVIEECQGCVASQICSECLYTQLKHKNNIVEYMRLKCAENRAKLDKLL